MEKKVKNLENHVIVCGYGRNGRETSNEFLEKNIPFVIIEQSAEIIEKIKDNPELMYVQGDTTQDEILEIAGVKKARALIATLPNDADNLFIVLSARELNKNLLIVTRASNDSSNLKLKQGGANFVIMPDKLGGQQMAKLVSHPDVVEFLDYILLHSEKEVNLQEIMLSGLSDNLNNSTIGEVNVRNKSGTNILGIKTAKGNYIFNPASTEKISNNDKLFVLGTPEQIESFKSLILNSVHE